MPSFTWDQYRQKVCLLNKKTQHKPCPDRWVFAVVIPNTSVRKQTVLEFNKKVKLAISYSPRRPPSKYHQRTRAWLPGSVCFRVYPRSYGHQLHFYSFVRWPETLPFRVCLPFSFFQDCPFMGLPPFYTICSFVKSSPGPSRKTSLFLTPRKSLRSLVPVCSSHYWPFTSGLSSK